MLNVPSLDCPPQPCLAQAACWGPGVGGHQPLLSTDAEPLLHLATGPPRGVRATQEAAVNRAPSTRKAAAGLQAGVDTGPGLQPRCRRGHREGGAGGKPAPGERTIRNCLSLQSLAPHSAGPLPRLLPGPSLPAPHALLQGLLPACPDQALWACERLHIRSSLTAPLPSRAPRASPGHCTGVTAQPHSRPCRRSPVLASRDVRGSRSQCSK